MCKGLQFRAKELCNFVDYDSLDNTQDLQGDVVGTASLARKTNQIFTYILHRAVGSYLRELIIFDLAPKPIGAQ